jgi:hypothetical protein
VHMGVTSWLPPVSEGVCDARNDGKAQKKRTVRETVLRLVLI